MPLAFVEVGYVVTEVEEEGKGVDAEGVTCQYPLHVLSGCLLCRILSPRDLQRFNFLSSRSGNKIKAEKDKVAAFRASIRQQRQVVTCLVTSHRHFRSLAMFETQGAGRIFM